MNKYLIIAVILALTNSCNIEGTGKTENAEKETFEEVINDKYELCKPTDPKAVLVLFGGYPESAKDIRREFEIFENAIESKVAVVYMNYSQKLWLEAYEKKNLAQQLQKIFQENNLPTSNTYFGGFSSGGNIVLLISDYLTEQSAEIAPKGVFIVDSPVDLTALYKSSEKNIARNFAQISVEESKWLIATLKKQFGSPTTNSSNYEDYSIYTSERDNFDNIVNLKNIKIRLYTEPDTLWWKQHRKADYEQMNAFYIKKLAERLKTEGFKNVEYIPTQNKGYRATGERHPHSWSIVDKNELLKWITE